MGPSENRDETRSVYSVGVLDENNIRSRVTAKWIEESFQCAVATSPLELLEQFDRTCMVLCLRDTDTGYDDLVREVWDTCPHTQILLLLGRRAFTSIDRECDETLQEPFGKNVLQQTVRRLFGRGLYNLKLRQYYQLRSYITGQEEMGGRIDEATLEELQEQCGTIEAEIDDIMSSFDQTDFEGVLRSHRQREKALETPSMDAEEEDRHSKYRPAKCHQCGLVWGATHGGRLGKGYEQVAALVWRCRGCGEVRKVSPGEYDRIL